MDKQHLQTSSNKFVDNFFRHFSPVSVSMCRNKKNYNETLLSKQTVI